LDAFRFKQDTLAGYETITNIERMVSGWYSRTTMANEIDQQVEALIGGKDPHGLLALVESGAAKPNDTFLIAGYKATLLPIAIERGWTELAVYLVQHGAEVNARRGQTAPIIAACEMGNREVVEALLTAGANVNVRAPKSDGEADHTPLMVAAEKSDIWGVRRLLASGADPAAQTCRKHTAVHYALMYYAVKPQPKPEATEIVRELLKAGCPLLGTELHFALYWRDVAMTALLLEHKCPVNEQLPYSASIAKDGPKKGDSPLLVVVRLNAVDLMGGEFGFETTDDRRMELIRMLLAAGADPNLGDGKVTPLRSLMPKVVGHEHFKFAELLVNGGADPDLAPPGSKLESPAAVAEKHQVVDFLNLFRSRAS
jgi:ankyrin repeat protein